MSHGKFDIGMYAPPPSLSLSLSLSLFSHYLPQGQFSLKVKDDLTEILFQSFLQEALVSSSGIGMPNLPELPEKVLSPAVNSLKMQHQLSLSLR